MEVPSGLLFVLLIASLATLDAELLRGAASENKVAASAPKGAALLQTHSADDDIDSDADEDMMFEGDVDDETSAESQLAKMHLADMLGYSQEEQEQNDRMDVEES